MGFRPIPNPYIVGNPIEDSRMFFGRADDFEFIRKKVTGNQKGGMIVLCGSRRSGKTSILFQIRQGRLGDDFIPVLIDMQSITVQNSEEFLENLAREIDSAFDSPESLVDDDLVSKLKANPLLAFNEFTARVNERLAGKNLILMFDEYELFESHIDKERFSSDVLNLMAYWMENNEGVFFLFTGSDKLELRDPRYWDSFLGKALHRRVSFLRHGDAMRLIHDPVEGLVEYEEKVPEEIFRLTAGQPFYTQVMCQSVVDHLNEAGKNSVTTADIESVVGEIIENPLPQMIFSWTSLSAMEKIALSIIAELSKENDVPVGPDEILDFADSEKIGYRLDPNKLRETVERLFSQDFLEKNPESELFTFKMDLWRRWIIRMHSIWQVLDEIAAEELDPEEGIEQVKRGRRLAAILMAAAAVIITLSAIGYSYYVRQQGKRGDFIAPLDSTTVLIETEPTGAQVFIDRTLIGSSPVSERVETGTSTLRISLEGYMDIRDSVSLTKDIPFERTFTLIEKTGSVAFSSSPPGASIELDGEQTGESTPFTFRELSINKLHTAVFRIKGYYARRIEGIEIFADSTVAISHDFAKLVHPLTVITVPDGASVTIDGRQYGKAPVSIREIEEGAHDISAGFAGYYVYRRSIDIPAEGNQIEIRLEELPPGKLILEILPYAELWIDGQLIERDAVNYRADLKPRSYEIELRHPVYGTVKETIIIKTGETITKTFNMEKEELKMIGEVLSERYRVDKKIGQGGFATVYLAFDTKLEREVAVKVLNAVEENESFRERFLRETQALANLNHPNILTVHDAGTFKEREYLIMELINGPSLESLTSRTSLSLPQVFSIALQTCEALEYAHQQGIIHRDLTLKNIMLDEQDAENARVKILDFGLVKFINSGQQTTGNVMMGTPAFMSPEQILGKEVDGRVDIWAFGIGLFRILTGEYPFAGEHPAALMYSIVNEIDIDFPETVPEGLRSVIKRCLLKEPTDRFQDFGEIASEIRILQSATDGDGDMVTTTVMTNIGSFADRNSKRNPYLNRVMIKNSRDFFGREKEVRKIYSRLDAPQPQSISVVGDRRIGKSSLLNFVYDKANRKKNMQNYKASIFAYLDFQNTVDNNVTKFIDLLFNVFSFETGDRTKYTARPKTLDQLKDVIQEIHESGRRIIIMMDEFELITRNENFEMEFFSFLRSLANSYRVSYITSSRDELQQMCHNQDISDSPFFNIFSNLPLRPFSRDEAVELIETPSKREGIPLEQYTDKILEIAGLFPFYLQIACSATFEFILDNPGTDPDWDSISRMFDEEAMPHYNFIWDRFEDAEKENLSRMAAGKTIDRKFQYVNENLVRKGYLVETPEGVSLCSTSFGRFIQRSQGVTGEGGKLSSIFGRFRKGKN